MLLKTHTKHNYRSLLEMWNDEYSCPAVHKVFKVQLNVDCPFTLKKTKSFVDFQNKHLCPADFLWATLKLYLSFFFLLSLRPRSKRMLIEWSISWAALHLDASGRPPAGWQHWARREGAGSRESASRTQWIHVSLHSPESFGFDRYAHPAHSFWYA